MLLEIWRKLFVLEKTFLKFWNFLSPVVTPLIQNSVRKVENCILNVNGYKNDRSQ